MTTKARYFDGHSSTAREVELALYDDGRLAVSGPGVARTATVREVRVSERIGNTMRRLWFDDGATCEVQDNDLIDQWLARLGAQSAEHRVFRLERSWHYALLALLVTAVGSWAFIRWGIPAAADHAARVLPRSVDTVIGQGGLEALDHVFLRPSQLSMAQQTQLRALFDEMQREMATGLPMRLELRAGGRLGANAFALPSGIIVVTDELVRLAEHPQEIESVLAHEVGHIVHRHSLRMLLTSSASALLMFTLFGDVNSMSTLAASVPTVLVQAKHSRDFEREADSYSRAWLEQRHIPSHYFGDLLRRLEQQQKKQGYGEGDGVMSYFSSHPRTEERASE